MLKLTMLALKQRRDAMFGRVAAAGNNDLGRGHREAGILPHFGFNPALPSKTGNNYSMGPAQYTAVLYSQSVGFCRRAFTQRCGYYPAISVRMTSLGYRTIGGDIGGAENPHVIAVLEAVRCEKSRQHDITLGFVPPKL